MQGNGGKTATAQMRYNCKFDRTIGRMPQLYSGQYIYVERPPAQMTELARMASAPIPNQLKTSFPFVG